MLGRKEKQEIQRTEKAEDTIMWGGEKGKQARIRRTGKRGMIKESNFTEGKSHGQYIDGCDSKHRASVSSEQRRKE